MTYNGYKDQDAFHEALAEGMAKYAAEQAAAIAKDGGKGWVHAYCSHADGICTGGGF
jgi:hypothetical protein